MTPTQATTGSSSAGTTVTATLTGVAAGNCVIASVGYNDTSGLNATPAVPSGWTAAVNPPSTSGSVGLGNPSIGASIFYQPASAGGSITFTMACPGGGSNLYSKLSLVEWPITSATPLDQHAGPGTSQGASTTTGSTPTTGTLSQATETVVAVVSIGAITGLANAAISTPAGYTALTSAQDTATGPGVEIAYKDAGATTGQLASWTWTSDSTQLGTQQCIATFIQPSGGPVINTKNQTETIVLIDQETKLRKFTRALIEAFAVDPDTSTKVNATFLGETITLTDLVSGQVVKVRLSADALTTSDKLTDSVYRNRLPLDMTVVTDTLTDFAVRCRALNEQLVMIDTLLKAGGNIVNTKSISEAFLIADILAQRLVLNRAIGETISLTDALLALKSGIQIKLLSEAIAVGDSNAESVYRSRLLIDTAAFVDSLQGAKGKFASFTDNIAVADAVMRLVQNSRAIAESTIINDLFAKVILNTRSLPEFISMFDLQLGVYVPFINVTDIAKVQITLGAREMVSLGANDFIRLGAA